MYRTLKYTQKLKIGILTSGRFHVCDLARELSRFGHDVRFYSLVPPHRTKQFGLPHECNRWLLPRVLGPAAAARFARGSATRARSHERLVLALDSASTLR